MILWRSLVWRFASGRNSGTGFFWFCRPLRVTLLRDPLPPRLLRRVGPIQVEDAKADPGALPLPALLSPTRMLTLAITLRYCQVTVNVQRQYSYVRTHRIRCRRLLHQPSLLNVAGSIPASTVPGPDHRSVTLIFILRLLFVTYHPIGLRKGTHTVYGTLVSSRLHPRMRQENLRVRLPGTWLPAFTFLGSSEGPGGIEEGRGRLSELRPSLL